MGTSSVVPDIFVWSVSDGTQLNHFLYSESTIDVKFSPDGNLLAVSGNIPGAVTIWDIEDESMTELGRGVAIDFIPNTSTLIVTTGQRSPNDPSPVYSLDLQNGQEERLYLGESSAGNVAISPKDSLKNKLSSFVR